MPVLVVVMVVIVIVIRISVLKGCRTFQLDFQKSRVLKIFQICPNILTVFVCTKMVIMTQITNMM